MEEFSEKVEFGKLRKPLEGGAKSMVKTLAKIDDDFDDSKLVYATCVQNEISFLVDTGSMRSLLPHSVFEPDGETKIFW